VQAIRQADASIAALQQQYDGIAAQWQQWADYRAYYVDALKRTAAPPAAVSPSVVAPAAAAPPVAATSVAGPTLEPAFAPPSPEATPAAVAGTTAWTAIAAPAPSAIQVPDLAPAAAPAPMPAAASAPVTEPAAAPAQSKRRSAAAREALTAPALLGVAGASLLVAAAIVFVALAWTSFSPATRGTVVLAVGVMVGALAVWVKRLGLTASAGAIGVVSMGFAGVASIAYFRDSGALGSFDTAAALLVASGAGLLLSRFAIPWVGSAAALSMAGSVVGFTVAATTTAGRADTSAPGIGAMPVWIVVGTAAACALAASHRLWRWQVAKSIVSWASVVWLGLVGLSVPVWVWFGDGATLDALLGLLPVTALALLATRWQLLATGPAALVFTLIVPALAATLGAGAWLQAAASVASVTCLLALGRWLPRKVLHPLFIGVSPAYAVVAVASASYSVAITIGRTVAGTYVPDTQMWAGVAALIAGLAIATLRLWHLTWTVLKVATVIGAAMVAVGAGITAFGVAELTGPPSYHSSVAVAMTVAAVGLIAMTRVWWERPARLVSELGALAFLITAIVHADWAVAISELNVVLAAFTAAAPLAVFAARAKKAPWWSAPYLLAGATALAASLAGRYGAELALIAAVTVLTMCVIAWTAWRLPRALHGPLAVGLAPAAAVGLAAAVGTLVAGLPALALSEPRDTGSVWWNVAVLALAIAIAASPRWHVPPTARAIVPSVGAVSLLVAAVGVALNAADAWGAGAVGSASAAVLLGALVALPGVLLWREARAGWVNGIGSAALATLAGVSALVSVASPAEPLWLPLAVALAATAALAIGATWWPKVAVAPAVFLATGVGFALTAREGGFFAAVAVAAVLAAVTMWLPFARHLRPLAAIGAAPAFALGLLASLFTAIAAVGWWVAAAVVNPPQVEIWWVLLAHAATIAALAAVPRLSAGRAKAPTNGMRAAGWALALLAIVFAVTSTTLVAGPDSSSWRDAAVAAVAAQAAATISALSIAWAHSVFVRAPLASRGTRRAVRVGATGWVACVALLGAWHVYSSELNWQAGAIMLAISVAALLATARWWPRAALAPATTLATAIPLVIFADGSSSQPWGLAAAAVVAAVLVWAERLPGISRRIGGVIAAGMGVLALGSIPAVVINLPSALIGAGQSLAEFVRHLLLGGSQSVELRFAVTFGALVVVALSVRAFARTAPFIFTVGLTLALASVHAVWAAVVLMVLEVGLILAHRAVRSSAKVAAIAGMGALAWASHEWFAVAAASSLLAVLAVVVVQRRGRRSPTLAVLAAPAAASLAAYALGHGIGSHVATWLAGPAAAVALVAVAALIWRRVPLISVKALPWELAAVPVAIALISQSLESAGTVLLIAGVAWFALASKEVPVAQWYASVFASIGVALIMWGAGASAVEAYTLAPATCALVIGMRWMRSAPNVSSLAALSPGLAIGLVPSYIALLNAPDNLARTAWLTFVMVALAVVGLQQRWFAPVVATATTAVIVAVLQVVVGSNLVFRLIAFLVVGSLLLVAASWFDKIKTLR